MLSTKTKKQSTAKHEALINNAPKLHETFEIGDVSHQGDIIIVRIASLPKSAKPRANRQLAEGDTPGSRHVLTRGKVYTVDPQEVVSLIKSACPKSAVQTQYVGPVFVSPKNPTANDLDHPEHGPQGFPAGSICAVVFQRNCDAEERERRVQD